MTQIRLDTLPTLVGGGEISVNGLIKTCAQCRSMAEGAPSLLPFLKVVLEAFAFPFASWLFILSISLHRPPGCLF